MSPRAKKLIGFPLLLAGLAIYIGVAATLAEFVPDFWLAKLVYFAAAGIAWAAPAIPLINWMNAPRKDTP